MKIIQILFGILFSLIGLVNLFWGNDPFYGLFVILLAAVYFPPVQIQVQKFTGFQIPGWAKVIAGLFILWSSLGVGELGDKVDLMLKSLN